MKYSFYWKFALNIKLNVNIVELIESRLEILMNKYKNNLFRKYPKNITDGFPNSENVEQTLTVKRIAGKLKTIRRNFKKAVDTNIEAAVWGCSVEKVFLEISQNSQEKTWLESLF